MTKENLFEKMKYIVFCMEREVNPQDCASHAAYAGLLRDSAEHCGDCTKVAASCSRCSLNHIEIEAQNCVIVIMSDEKGHCGKKCISECQYKPN